MKRILLAFLLVFAHLVFSETPARAQVPSLTVSPGPDAAAFAASFGYTPDQVTKILTDRVNGLFQVANVNSFLRDFQNAQSFSTRGLGVDYASEATLAEVGATFSFATNLDKAYKPSGGYINPPVSGGGANFSLMGGLGLGLFGFDPIMIFGNWFKGSATLGQLSGSYQNWGLHGQLRLLGPSRGMSATNLLVRWGGVAITSGADYSRLSIGQSRSISSSFDLASQLNSPVPVPLMVQSVGDVTFNLQQTTWTIPLEITTSLRLLSLLTLYGGLGFDWQLGGGSDLTLKLSADLTTPAPNGSGKLNLGTATLDVPGHASPSTARMREIVGLQINAFLVRFFAQVNMTANTPLLMSFAAGLRLAI